MPSRSSIVTGVTTSGMTTPVDPPSPSQELQEVPLPLPTLPELPELPGITDFNRRVEALWQRVKSHNQHLRELSLTPEEHLERFHIWSGINLDKVAFTKGHITHHHLWEIDQNANPQFYTKSSQHVDNNYESPCFQDISSEGEEEEEVKEEEECPLPIPDPLGTHLEILHSEHSSREQFSESTRDLLDRHLGTIIEEMFQCAQHWNQIEPSSAAMRYCTSCAKGPRNSNCQGWNSGRKSANPPWWTCRHEDTVPQFFYHIDSHQHHVEHYSSLPHLHSMLLSIVK